MDSWVLNFLGHTHFKDILQVHSLVRQKYLQNLQYDQYLNDWMMLFSDGVCLMYNIWSQPSFLPVPDPGRADLRNTDHFSRFHS